MTIAYLAQHAEGEWVALPLVDEGLLTNGYVEQRGKKHQYRLTDRGWKAVNILKTAIERAKEKQDAQI